MRNFVLLPLLCFCITSCNVYSPLNPKSSTEDLVEEGRKCLHDGNYGCAIEAYSAIPDAAVKQEKLCLTYLTQGGVTLTLLANTLTSGSSKILGDIGNALIPWSSDKSTALDNAKTACLEFASVATETKSVERSSLLRSLALISHCSIRMAKTDQFVATSNSDTTCNTAGNNSGTLTPADIAESSTGAITTSGMCAADVTTCNEDINSLSGGTAGLVNAGLSNVKTGVDAIPDALKSSGQATNAARGALRDTVQ